ncbi:MAG: gliding motility protein GldN [Bacteroidales bacterium]|nr:gliding motility protein GldN [Bacteroidales bacterium]
MKHTVIIATLLMAFASTSVTWAQTVRPTAPAKATAAPAKPAATPTRGAAAPTTAATSSARERLDAAAAAQKTDPKQLSVRAQSKFGSEPVSVNQTVWSREIYRELSDTKEENMPLFSPSTPIGDRANLFTLIFRLLAEGKITAYEIDVDGREIFTDDHKINFKDLLELYEIINEEEVVRGSKTVTYKIENSDIPSKSVKSFYIKEVYRFDQRSSQFTSSIYCICPLIIRQDDFGMSTRVAMFWVKYEDLAPFLTQTPILSSNTNNTLRLTYADYFTMKQYKGDIFYATNLANKSLAQIANNDSTKLRKEREKIEQQIDTFEASLWVKPDTTLVVDKSKKAKAKTARAESKSTTTKSKAKAPATKTSSSRTVRASVRK